MCGRGPDPLGRAVEVTVSPLTIDRENGDSEAKNRRPRLRGRRVGKERLCGRPDDSNEVRGDDEALFRGDPEGASFLLG